VILSLLSLNGAADDLPIAVSSVSILVEHCPLLSALAGVDGYCQFLVSLYHAALIAHLQLSIAFIVTRFVF
jgi:hypothetical protein